MHRPVDRRPNTQPFFHVTMASQFKNQEEALNFFRALGLEYSSEDENGEGEEEEIEEDEVGLGLDEGSMELPGPDPAELESALWLDRELANMEIVGPDGPLNERFEELQVVEATVNAGPLNETFEEPQVVNVVEATVTAAPPPKRPRGRPRKKAVVVDPPPPPVPSERPGTPPPVLTQDESNDYKERSLAREEVLAKLLALKKPSQAQTLEKLTVLREKEEDDHRCLGEWKWDEFIDEKEFINEDMAFGGKGGVMSEAAQRANSELDLFRLFLTNTVVENLVQQTNLYARQERAKEGGSNQNWTPVTREDIMAFLGVAIAMSLLRKSNRREYWSGEEVLDTPWFGTVMSGNRFESIQKYLHVANNTQAARTAEGNLCDKLYQVRPLLDSLLTSFPLHFFPRRELSIDEQMIGTKARCSFIQYMKNKPTRRGVKVWALCDARVHYCLNFQVYTGGTGEQGLSFRVVHELMSPYFGVGHHLYVDNFYTSPDLLAHLLSHNTLAVGTLRQNRKHVPMRIRTCCQDIAVGQSLFLSSHNMTVCRWMDKRDVFCLSTVHGNSLEVTSRRKRGGRGEMEEVQKPKAICDYNRFMGGVDVYDQLLSYHPITRRYKHWWVKVFWRLIDMAILNSLALWKLKHPDHSHLVHKQFRLQLCKQLAAGLMERDVPRQPRFRVAARLAHAGNPIYFPTQLQCTVCKNRNAKTKFGCSICGEGVRLHVSSAGEPSCFQIYHTRAILN